MEADLMGNPIRPVNKHWGQYQHHREVQFMPRDQAMSEIINNQPTYLDKKGKEHVWDPEDPPIIPTPFPNELHFIVHDTLQNTFDPDCELRFYSSSGSSLDKHYGIDGVFEMMSKGHRVSATIDLTRNRQKISHKADLIMQIPDDYVETKDSAERAKILKDWSEEIADLLSERMKDLWHARRAI